MLRRSVQTAPARRAIFVRSAAGVVFVLVLAFVLWGSLTQVTAPGGGRYDKLQHFAAYAALGAAGLMALPHRPWAALIAVILVGASVETLQAVLPLGRSGSLLDLAANLAGVALAGGVWRLLAARGGEVAR